MTQAIERKRQHDPVTIEQALVSGDLSGLDAEQRVNYYLKVCSSLQLNPYTRPFDYLVLNGKLVLYARKDATDQLRDKRKVSITGLERQQLGDLLVVTASARTADGRTDSSIGAVNVKGLFGEALANALMKAETKSKRRVTLSLCGLGMLDEVEVDSVPGAYFPEPDSDERPYVPTREREVDDRDIVRSADDKLWLAYEKRLDQARNLGLNPKPATLPMDRDELKRVGLQVVEQIEERQDQLDKEDADRIIGQAQAEGVI